MHIMFVTVVAWTSLSKWGFILSLVTTKGRKSYEFSPNFTYYRPCMITSIVCKNKRIKSSDIDMNDTSGYHCSHAFSATHAFEVKQQKRQQNHYRFLYTDLRTRMGWNEFVVDVRGLHRLWTRLFLTLRQPHKAASWDTLRRWAKIALADAGINMEIFKPHSIRSAIQQALLPGPNCLSTLSYALPGGFEKPHFQSITRCQSSLILVDISSLTPNKWHQTGLCSLSTTWIYIVLSSHGIKILFAYMCYWFLHSRF